MRALVLQYYVVLRAVLRAKPCLRECLTRCSYCRIFFLTHPCNAGRSDLRCPFGCQETHRKQNSTQRSVEYYGTEEGKIKKKIQNDKRRKNQAIHTDNPPEDAQRDLVLDGYRFDAGMAIYVRMVTSLIEGRRVSLGEILKMLVRAMRQHSIARRGRIDYVLRYLMNNAP